MEHETRQPGQVRSARDLQTIWSNKPVAIPHAIYETSSNEHDSNNSYSKNPSPHNALVLNILIW
jgi:hypothetical protein